MTTEIQKGVFTAVDSWYPEGFDISLIAKKESGGVQISGTVITKMPFVAGDYNLFGLNDFAYGTEIISDHSILTADSIDHAMIYPYKNDTRYFLIRFFKDVGAGTEFYVCGKAIFD